MAAAVRAVLIDITPLRVSVPFRRIFVARLISLVGIGMLLVSVPVQVYNLTGSSMQVGTATAVTGLATFLGMPLGGVLADRFDRRSLILVGRSAAALAFMGLAANAFGVFGQAAALPVLYVLAVTDGLIGALSIAALMAAIPTLIDRRHLPSVGALGAFSVRLGSAVSPGIAGFIIGAAGVQWAYVTAAVVATVAVLILLGLPSLPPDAAILGDRSERADEEPRDRTPDDTTTVETTAATTPSLWRFLRTRRVITAVMAVGTLAMFAPGIVALLPALVAQRFDGNASITGLLFAAVATGAMLGAITSGWLGGLRRPGVVLLAALTLTFVIMIAFGLAPYAWLMLGLLVVVGYFESVQEVLRYTLIQQHTPGPLLGRVNGIWMAQEVGGVTVGSLVAGAYGAIWVASDAVIYFGLTLLVLSLICAVVLRSLVRVRGERPTAIPVS
ncbi:putative siderophore export protein [Gordonia polyisoprenivorans NBRC 16320 = JCM 10675]|uniref:Multidrug efflux pump Tap n=2 Tax=Gordonia TaxID=2053 RepID=A0A846WL14_9ACTN|nr:MFS transporter [Gordonia polyisoprenivorans]NKY02355.1 MFS transporter [Gordonia polyisoprenivorans]OZC30491.1 MFS transporter [Gordonia polyisoprenivorans]WCB39642.1 MFS transporter [Gordonia polyisoprenivorans]GAB23488.1 putative siderophore export protein [Gordonia polyisoprenivorans NBRC 16320 = JCM 10675]